MLVEAGITAAVCEPLAAAGIAYRLFDGGCAEPPVEVAEEAWQVARQYGPQVIVGIGGGSNMDLAKTTAVLLTHGGPPHAYFGFDRVPGPVTPVICVATTAGTGSEVSHAAVLTDTANHVKVSILSNFLRPALAIVDPALTDSCPARVTADAGIDALTHAIEAYTAREYSQMDIPGAEPVGYDGSYPLTEVLAERAVRLIGQHLRRAVRNGGDRQARDGMALAATLAGLAFSNSGVALVHALEYPLGAAVHCSHGAGNGLLLPHVMRFNAPTCPDKLARIAQWLEPATFTAEATAEDGIRAVERLCRDVGIPARLRDLGIREEQLPELAEKAYLIRRLRKVNPRDATRDDLLNIYKAAY
jgi:alcohol dehydrogenase class IV